MRLLISNDDGIHAVGIQTLIQTMCTEHDVYVVAPDRERSAAGHALTLHKPLRVAKVDLRYPVKVAWETTGTPSDCIKLTIHSLLYEENKPDMVISGINHGPNLGVDVLYSGTVSAAMEGAMFGIPSIAVSLTNGNDKNADFHPTANFILKFIRNIDQFSPPMNTIFNVNVPGLPENEIAGIAITKIGTRMYTDTYEKRIDPRGGVYYWLAGERITESDDKEADINAIRNNMISITPVTIDLTKRDLMKGLGEYCKTI